MSGGQMWLVTAGVGVWLAAMPIVPAASQAPRSVWDGVYTEAQAARGAAVYAERCANCHGASLGGVEAAPALTGVVFGATWEGATLADLLERIRTSMPQDNPGSLSRRQNADIVAYVLQVGKFPPGSAELPQDAAALGLITIRSVKPDP